MSTTFEARSVTVGDLFSDSNRARLIVPEFQRGYEWGKKHAETFLRDILQFQNERQKPNGPKRYFLGPIVVLSHDEDHTELLDGQQRLATATILLAVIRDIAAEFETGEGHEFARDTQNHSITKETAGKGENVYALTLGETDESYFRETIQRFPPTIQKPTKLRTHKNIKEARDVLFEQIKARVAGPNRSAALDSLRLLRQTIKSDLILASIPVADERDAFRIFETLNDRGMRLSPPDLLLNYLMRVAPKKDRHDIRKLWTEMIHQMERRDPNKFLRHLWVSRYGDIKNKDLFTAIKEQIEANDTTSLDFAKACVEECEFYSDLVTFDKEQLKESARLVENLVRDLGAQSALPLLLSAIQKWSVTEFQKLCQLLLVFVTRHSVIANLESTELEGVLFELALHVRTSRAAPKADLKVIKQKLVSAAPTDDKIRASFSELILSPNEARYVIHRLAERMQTNTKELGPSEANIEHIFPKSPNSNEWGGRANQDLLEQYLWHVGNLTLYGQRLNRDDANSEFSKKRARYEKASELVIANKVAAYKTWDVQTIKDRAAGLAPIALDVWSFENSSRV